MDAELRRLVVECIVQHQNNLRVNVADVQFSKIYESDREIYKVSLPGITGQFALKVRLGNPGKPGDLVHDAAEREFRILENVHSTIRKSGDELSMPVPLAVYPRHSAILTTWCDGRELRKTLYAHAWHWPASEGDLRRRFMKCGEWLGLFHATSMRTVGADAVVSNRLQHANRMLAEISESARNSLSDRQLLRLQTVLKSCLAGTGKTFYGQIHGNFTLRNVLVSNSTAAPVDFEDSRDDSVFLDVGQFIADIMLSAYRPFIWRNARRHLASAFLSTYHQHVSYDIEQVRGYTIYSLLATYFEIVTRQVRNPFEIILAQRQLSVFSDMLRRPEEVVREYV